MEYVTEYISVLGNIEWSWLYTLQVFGGMAIGTFIFLFILPLIPNAVATLSNDPNKNRPSNSEEWDYEPSNFGFFTELSPGRVKIIERGGRFIKCIMRYDDHRFLGELESFNPRSADYWEVVKNEKRDDPDSHPLPIPTWTKENESLSKGALIFLSNLITYPVRFLWWIWKIWVYTLTGHVFTGLWPFQQVRIYPIRRYKIVKHADGHEEIHEVQDFSDHFRVADAQFPVFVPMAETKDKIPVKLRLNVMIRVYNPYKTAYGIDDWSARCSSAISDEGTHFTRPKPLSQVLTSEDESDVRELSDSIKKIGDRGLESFPGNSLIPIGIEITQALVPDISLAREEDIERLGDVARAVVDRDAKKERAKGDASQIRELSKAVRHYKHIGLAALSVEKSVRTAEAAGDKAIVVMGGDNSTDPIQAATLKEIQSLREENNTKPEEKGGVE